MPRILTGDSNEAYSIRPAHIDTTKHFWDAFGCVEAEESAGLVVRFCQARNGWMPFLPESLAKFYEAEREGREWHQLLWANFMIHFTRGYIVRQGDMLYITHEFVTRCFLGSPAPEIFAAEERTDL